MNNIIIIIIIIIILAPGPKRRRRLLRGRADLGQLPSSGGGVPLLCFVFARLPSSAWKMSTSRSISRTSSDFSIFPGEGIIRKLFSKFSKLFFLGRGLFESSGDGAAGHPVRERRRDGGAYTYIYIYIYTCIYI